VPTNRAQRADFGRSDTAQEVAKFHLASTATEVAVSTTANFAYVPHTANFRAFGQARHPDGSTIDVIDIANRRARLLDRPRQGRAGTAKHSWSPVADSISMWSAELSLIDRHDRAKTAPKIVAELPNWPRTKIRTYVHIRPGPGTIRRRYYTPGAKLNTWQARSVLLDTRSRKAGSRRFPPPVVRKNSCSMSSRPAGL